MHLTQTASYADNIWAVPRKKTNKVVLAARVSEAEFKGLEDLASRDQVTMTEIIRQWLRTLSTYRPAPIRSHKA
jgi:hypothetical protein